MRQLSGPKKKATKLLVAEFPEAASFASRRGTQQ